MTTTGKVYEPGARLKRLRIKARKSQNDVARAADLHTGHYAHIEQGAILRPHARTLERIASALGVSPEWLAEHLYGKDRP